MTLNVRNQLILLMYVTLLNKTIEGIHNASKVRNSSVVTSLLDIKS